MLTQVRAADITLRGLSVGGIYTALHARELDVLFDVGMAPRSFAGVKALLLSHGHADHIGALTTLLGARMLTCGNRKLRVFLPAEISDDVRAVIDVVDALQRHPTDVELVALRPGDEAALHSDVYVRAFRTHHPVPSLGYLLFRRVHKLRGEHLGLDGQELRRRREAGEQLTDPVDHLELAYVTDSLPKVLDEVPELFDVKTLILECTFLDERKSPELAHVSCHVHLDDLLPYADRFRNQAVVLMHFSQLYRPDEVHRIVAARCPPGLRERAVVFAPERRSWPG